MINPSIGSLGFVTDHNGNSLAQIKPIDSMIVEVTTNSARNKSYLGEWGGYVGAIKLFRFSFMLFTKKKGVSADK